MAEDASTSRPTRATDPPDVGWPGGVDPSVSKAVGEIAKAAGKAQPDPAWVAPLPASQKCG